MFDSTISNQFIKLNNLVSLTKMKYAIFCCVAVLVMAVGSLAETPPMYFERHFRALSTVRHPRFEGGDPWRQGRMYVLDRMRHYGLPLVQEQAFNTTVGAEPEMGINLIGVAEGENPAAPVIVVGADYSTRLAGNPLKDNTGGVACFLETIHLFYHNVKWNPFFQNNTVIFVAFDLNTKEYEMSGLGQPGVFHFVSEWLTPYLNNETHPKEFLGAVILDSVTTYNTENRSQELRDGFNKTMPGAYSDIMSHESKGDFLGFLYPSVEKENAIKTTFFQKYRQDRMLRPFRLQDMEMHLKISTVTEDVKEMFNHQAQYYFWTNPEKPLAAFLLFDTDGDRTDPTPDACVATKCDVEKFLTKERIGFMTHTTNSLVSTLLQLQTTHYELPPSASTGLCSSLFLVLASLLAALLFKR